MNTVLEQPTVRRATPRIATPSRRAATPPQPQFASVAQYMQALNEEIARFQQIVPPDAMTGEEFERGVIEDLTALYKEHGLI